jgi:hypothetical protein
MAMMVHPNCRYGCCEPDPHRAVRSREKRSWVDWAGEYEDPPEIEARACPKGGPDCGCDYPNDQESF